MTTYLYGARICDGGRFGGGEGGDRIWGCPINCEMLGLTIPLKVANFRRKKGVS
jgi:hypothetical protein